MLRACTNPPSHRAGGKGFVRNINFSLLYLLLYEHLNTIYHFFLLLRVHEADISHLPSVGNARLLLWKVRCLNSYKT